MEFDFKITTWERVRVSEKYEQEILQAIKDGQITSPEDVWIYYSERGIDDDEPMLERMDEREEPMTPEENGGNATICVTGDDYEDLFDNQTIKP